MSSKNEKPSANKSTQLNSDQNEILIVSPNHAIEDQIKKRLGKFGVSTRVISDLNELMTTELVKSPKVVIVDANLELTDTLKDVIVLLNSGQEEVRVLVAYTGRLAKSPENLLLAGATSVYQLPFEEELLINQLFSVYKPNVANKSIDKDSLVQVSMIDFEGCDKFPFDTYLCLPFNNRVFLYKRMNSAVEETTLAKFKANKNLLVYIQRSDLEDYHLFCTNRLLSAHSSDQKFGSQAMKTEVTKMLKTVFTKTEINPEDQAQLVDSVKKVTAGLLTKLGEKNKYLSRVMALCSASFSNYNHAMNVATYCALFGIVLDYEDPSGLYLGGLLHDIGHAESIGDFGDDMDNDKKHSLNSIDILNQKGLDIPTEVQMMVLQHHEHSDGTGFPEKLKSDQIHEYAKICALADYIDKATSLSMGHFRQSPTQALKTFAGIDSKIPHASYDKAFHERLVKALLDSEEQDSSTTVSA